MFLPQRVSPQCDDGDVLLLFSTSHGSAHGTEIQN